MSFRTRSVLTVIRFRFDLFSRAAKPLELRVLTSFALRSGTSLGVNGLADHVGHRVVAHQVIVDHFSVGNVMHH